MLSAHTYKVSSSSNPSFQWTKLNKIQQALLCHHDTEELHLMVYEKSCSKLPEYKMHSPPSNKLLLICKRTFTTECSDSHSGSAIIHALTSWKPLHPQSRMAHIFYHHYLATACCLEFPVELIPVSFLSEFIKKIQFLNLQFLQHLLTPNSSLHLLKQEQNWEKMSEIIQHTPTTSWHFYLTEFPIHSNSAVRELHSLIKIINYVHPIICLSRHVCFHTTPNTGTTTPDNPWTVISPRRYSKCN
jgi:hypothetical protein